MKGGWPSAAVFVFVIALLSGAHFASADQTNVELLIDDSGSMAQGIGGGKKIDVAKQVLSGLIHDLPAEAQVAVRTYGRRQPSRLKDCGDMELLVPFGPNTAERVLPGVQALKPNGMTPIAASLQAAAADFSGREGQNNIVILLSDGEEDCHGDPCAAAKTLHDAGIHLEINVIGLHVQPNERTQLQCVAKSGGGKYYDAANAGELKVAASEVKERIATAPAPTPQASPTPFDLLAKANGGQVLVAPNDKWLKTISGDESGVVFDYGGAGEAVFAFKDEQPATFDTFAMLIPGTGDNVREFELFTASDSPTGNFTSIGKFTAANVKMIKSPYQEFKFAPVTAKYLKVKILSSYNPNGTVLYQFRLTGKLGGTVPAAASTAPPSTPKEIDLLAKANGGQVLVAPNDRWLKTISGDESGAGFDYHGAGEAVFAFKDEQPATFDTFTILIPGSGDNVREFELFTASDSPSGTFTSIGKFTAANVKMIKSPYQEFKFAPVTAKYLKVKILSSYNPNGTVLYQFRLMGKPAVPVR